MDDIIIGKVLRPKGIDGSLKIEPITKDINRFFALDRVFIDGVEFCIQKCNIYKGFVYLKLENIDDINGAEEYKNKLVKIGRENLIDLEDNEFLIADLLNMEVFDESGQIGYIEDVIQTGAADVYVVKTLDNKRILFPFLKKIINSVDIENKKMYLLSDRLNEVAVYED